MSTNLVVCGVTYPFPAVGEKPWAQRIINWATAVTAGMLQKSGGTFALTADVDFGASYGLKCAAYKTRSANPAAAGIVRLANNEAISWRNAVNGADLALKANASDDLEFNGVALGNVDGPSASVDGELALFSGTSGKLLKRQARTVSITSGSSNNFSTSGGSEVEVTGIAVAFTSTGRPVLLMLIPDGSGSSCSIAVAKSGSANTATTQGTIRFYRDATQIGQIVLNHQFPADTSTSHRVDYPPSAFAYVDQPIAGTYTYTVKVRGDTYTQVMVLYSQLVVREI